MSRNFNLFLCGLLFTAVLLISGGCGKKKVVAEDADSLLKAAYAASCANDWKDALTFSEKALAKDNNNTQIRIMYALALEHCGKPDDALGIISSTTYSDPKSFMAQYIHGRTLFIRGKYKEALAPLQKAFTLNPEHEATLLLLEKSLMRVGNRDASKYCKALLKHPNAEIRKKYKNSPMIWNEMGIYYATIAGKPDLALLYFEKALKVKPDQPECLLNYAVVLDFMKDNPEDAQYYYQRYAEVTANRFGMEAKRNEVINRLQSIR